MGHARADVFRRHYMHQTVKVDTQSAYLGTASRADLIKTIDLMSNRRDPRAPVKLDAEDLEDDGLENHPKLSALKIKRDRLKTNLKAEYRTVTGSKAFQPEKHQEYTRLTHQISSTRAGLKRSAPEYFRQQLKGTPAATFTYPKPKFGCPLRSQISDAFSPVGMTPNKWSETVRALTTLCAQKPRIHTKATEGKNPCFFCYIDDELSPADRLYQLYSLGTLRAHINNKHLPITTSLRPVNCPYPACASALLHGEHLKNRFAVVHDLKL